MGATLWETSGHRALFIDQACGRRRAGAARRDARLPISIEPGVRCSARLCGITPTRQGPPFVSRERAGVNVHAHTLKASKAKGLSRQLVSRERSPELYLGCDPRQGREVLGQAEPYQKWHSYAFRDPRCLRKPWKREHRREYMHERPSNCRSKFPEQGRLRPFVPGLRT